MAMSRDEFTKYMWETMKKSVEESLGEEATEEEKNKALVVLLNSLGASLFNRSMK